MNGGTPTSNGKQIRSDSVAGFYDEFLRTKMLAYRVDGNIRIDAAIELAKPFVRPHSCIADIGCGIGLVSEALANAEPTATVLGLDISPANIAYARKTVEAANVEFIAVSVEDQIDVLKGRLPKPADLICLIDVIEHVPATERAKVFQDLAEASSADAVLVMSYPSPEYQRHLQEHRPEELQVIDNVIELGQLMEEAQSGSWRLDRFRYRDVWQTNQYCHAVFQKRLPLEPQPDPKLSI